MNKLKIKASSLLSDYLTREYPLISTGQFCFGIMTVCVFSWAKTISFPWYSEFLWAVSDMVRMRFGEFARQSSQESLGYDYDLGQYNL